MELEDSVVLGVFVLAMVAPAYIFVRVWFSHRPKRDVQDVEVAFETDNSVGAEIEAKLCAEFQQRIARSDKIWLTWLAGVSIALVAVVYVVQLEKWRVIAVLITLTASGAFIYLRKRFSQSREEAKKVSLTLCSEWLTYRYSCGENRIKLESIAQVSYSNPPYSNLTVTATNGRTAQFVGFDNADKIYFSIRRAIERRKRDRQTVERHT